MLTAGYASGAAVGKFPFDGDNTFGFVSMVCAYPFVYCVPKDSPIQSFPDMLARAKANPGKLTYVITSLGSVYHLIGSWVGMKAGIDMVPMPYRGSAAAVTDVLSGPRRRHARHRDLRLPAHPSGQFRALAVTSPDALSADAGRADRGRDAARRALHVVARAWRPRRARRGRSSTASTPRSTARWNCRMCRQKLKEGGNIGTPTTPEAMRKQIDDEIANWKQLIKANNIKVD